MLNFEFELTLELNLNKKLFKAELTDLSQMVNSKRLGILYIAKPCAVHLFEC